MRSKEVGWLVAGVLAAAMVAPALRAQTARQDPDVLNALLIEVRGLRAAMEELAVGGARVQLSLGRLQLQEQRLNTMLRRLETVREEAGHAERNVTQVESEILRAQQMIKNTEANTTIGAEQRADVLRQLAMDLIEIKRRSAQATADLQRFQLEQSTLEQQISSEQARWIEINRAMEDLEKTLAKRR
jgi:predicted  nucleic acid-binding Zn-ribbon protein